MKWIRNCFILIVLPIKLLSCTSGYKKIEGKWYYVTYNEGNWADRHNLDIDYNSFEVLSDPRFGKDNTKVFFEGRLIEHAHSPTFKLIGKGYAADHIHVYYQSYLITGASPEGFKVLKYPYSRDNKTIFCGNVPMRVDNIDQFKVKKKGAATFIQPVDKFIKENIGFENIDPAMCKYVIYANGEAETKTSKYKGFKKID